MEAILELLSSIFGENVDLAAVASGAGLFGGGASAALALAVSGTIARFLLRTLLTAVMTGGGFLFLLNYLGFQIVPPESLQDQFPFGSSYSAEKPSASSDEEVDEKACRVTFRRFK